MSGRSSGLVVVAVLNLLQGIVGIALALRILFLGARLTGWAGTGHGLGLLLVLLSAIGAIGPLLHLAFGWGALRRASWAWGMGLLASVAGLIGAVVHRGADLPSGVWLVWPAIAAITIAYLVSPAGRRSLAGDGGPTPPAAGTRRGP